MNKYLPYEEVITKKMEELPLPDMQEAIWNSIQAKIGTSVQDASSDGASLSQQAAINSSKIITGFIISVIIVVITIIVVNRKKKATQNMNPAPEVIQPQAPGTDSSIRQQQKKKSSVPFIKADTNFSIPQNTGIDTPTTINPVFIPIIKTDSSGLVLPVILPKKDTIVKNPGNQLKKRTIGVIGISDSSYRISGKRDSLK